MTAARRAIPSAPPPPASHTRATTLRRSVEALSHDVSRLLPRVDDEVRALRTEADARREEVSDRHDTMEKQAARMSADKLDAEARALQDAADELRWLASLAP